MRVYARLADGTWSPTPVFEGPMSDGTNFTIPDVSQFVADFIASLIYRHYDQLRATGREIVGVTTFGHPHFGIVIPPEDYVWVICSEVLTRADQAGDVTPEEIAQDCATGRWMLGWNEFTAVPQSSVMGDRTVPTDSSMGLDTNGSFHIGDLQFDQTVLTSARVRRHQLEPAHRLDRVRRGRWRRRHRDQQPAHGLRRAAVALVGETLLGAPPRRVRCAESLRARSRRRAIAAEGEPEPTRVTIFAVRSRQRSRESS